MPSHPLHRGTRLNGSLAHCEKERGRRNEPQEPPTHKAISKDGHPKARQRAVADSATFPLLRFAFFRVSTYN
jgi:hypothetical protein